MSALDDSAGRYMVDNASVTAGLIGCHATVLNIAYCLNAALTLNTSSTNKGCCFPLAAFCHS